MKRLLQTTTILPMKHLKLFEEIKQTLNVGDYVNSRHRCNIYSENGVVKFNCYVIDPKQYGKPISFGPEMYRINDTDYSGYNKESYTMSDVIKAFENIDDIKALGAKKREAVADDYPNDILQMKLLCIYPAESNPNGPHNYKYTLGKKYTTDFYISKHKSQGDKEFDFIYIANDYWESTPNLTIKEINSYTFKHNFCEARFTTYGTIKEYRRRRAQDRFDL